MLESHEERNVWKRKVRKLHGVDFCYCCRAGDGVIARIFDVDLELLSYVLDKVKDLKKKAKFLIL